MKILQEVYEEMSLTWLGNLFLLFKATIITFTDLRLDLQRVPTKLFVCLILQGPYLTTKSQLNVKGNILLKALKANKQDLYAVIYFNFKTHTHTHTYTYITMRYLPTESCC